MKNPHKLADMSLLAPLISDSIKGGGNVKLIVTGNSMYPLLRSRQDTVILKKFTTLKKYDIPLYMRPDGTYVLHRIVKITNNQLHLAGDNEINIEYPVEKSQVIAVVSGFYRKNKYYSVKNPIIKLYTFIWCKIIPHRHIVLRKLLKFYSRFRKK